MSGISVDSSMPLVRLGGRAPCYASHVRLIRLLTNSSLEFCDSLLTDAYMLPVTEVPIASWWVSGFCEIANDSAYVSAMLEIANDSWQVSVICERRSTTAGFIYLWEITHDSEWVSVICDFRHHVSQSEMDIQRLRMCFTIWILLWHARKYVNLSVTETSTINGCIYLRYPLLKGCFIYQTETGIATEYIYYLCDRDTQCYRGSFICVTQQLASYVFHLHVPWAYLRDASLRPASIWEQVLLTLSSGTTGSPANAPVTGRNRMINRQIHR